MGDTGDTKAGLLVVAFTTTTELYDWLLVHYATCPGIWLRMYKKASGQTSITWAEAVEVALCFGWIDSVKNTYDDASFIQKFTPRRARSMWSKKNCQTAERLIDAGLMQPAGQVQIDAAKADGRWDLAYESPSNMTVPADFIVRLRAYPAAEAFYNTLNKTNLYAIAFRLTTAKRPETRQRRVETIIAMLNEGKKFH